MSTGNPEKRGLGRGLSALMADVEIEPVDNDQQDRHTQTQKSQATAPVETLHPNPEQPRQDFDKIELEELAASIRERGIIQPLIVRVDQTNGGYQIVAGERRWRAAQLANLHDIPIIIKDLTDSDVLEIAIIENIQRADLNAVEEAQGYKQLMERFEYTQEQLSAILGKSRSHIANALRLLNLLPEVLDMLRAGKLSSGHARQLISAPNQIDLAKRIISKGLSVRQTEKLVKRPLVETVKTKDNDTLKDADTKALELDLGANIGMLVAINHNAQAGTGTVTIQYATLEELDEICGLLSFRASDETK